MIGNTLKNFGEKMKDIALEVRGGGLYNSNYIRVYEGGRKHYIR